MPFAGLIEKTCRGPAFFNAPVALLHLSRASACGITHE